MRHRDALRPAGRSRGEHDVGEIVGGGRYGSAAGPGGAPLTGASSSTVWAAGKARRWCRAVWVSTIVAPVSPNMNRRRSAG